MLEWKNKLDKNEKTSTNNIQHSSTQNPMAITISERFDFNFSAGSTNKRKCAVVCKIQEGATTVPWIPSFLLLTTSSSSSSFLDSYP
jgi:hypothetical protein